MKRKKGFWIAGLCGVAAAGAIAGGVLLFSGKEPSAALVSPGLCRLAEQATVCCSAPAGEAVVISPELLDASLSGAPLTALTVTALPPATEGQLLLGHATVAVGQTVPRETLSYLNFVPAEGVRESAFFFEPSTAAGPVGYTLSCRLKVTDGVNCCPVGRGSVMAVATHASLSLPGTLTASDPDGDPLFFEICRYPAHGTVTLDAATGDFVYTPDPAFDGEDAFTWRVQDDAGAFAPVAEVHITVRPLTTGWLYADMDGARHSDALTVSEKGWLSGDEVGGRHYFHPEVALSRAAFAAVLIKAADIKAPVVAATDFTDDDAIPAGMKAAAAYLREKGLVTGEAFCPDAAVTRSEAAVWAAAVLPLAAPVYADAVRDFDSIPVNTADALYAAYEAGLLATFADGTLSPDAPLTRGDAATFFARLAT